MLRSNLFRSSLLIEIRIRVGLFYSLAIIYSSSLTFYKYFESSSYNENIKSIRSHVLYTRRNRVLLRILIYKINSLVEELLYLY